MEIQLNNAAIKQFKRLNEPYRSRIAATIDKLAQNPLTGNIKKMQEKDGYRISVGDYRILFDILDDKIIIFKIAPRGQVYKE